MKSKKLDASKTVLTRRWRNRGGTWWWAIVVIVVPVALIAAAALTMLLMFVDPGSDVKNKIELIKVGLAVAAGTGGVVALVLTGRRQWSTEHDATERRLTDLYVKAVDQLGSDKAAVRHGGLYALERVAQDNPDHRQVVVDVICAYLRAPFQVPGFRRPRKRPGIHRPLVPRRGPSLQNTASGDRTESPNVAELEDDAKDELEVRLTAQRILAKHLRPGDDPKHPTKAFWKDINLDLAGATLIDFNLECCQINEASFIRVTFVGDVQFREATFTGTACFDSAAFAGTACFAGAAFNGAAWFREVIFIGTAWFDEMAFTSDTDFNKATFASTAYFRGTDFGGFTQFDEVTFASDADFDSATFMGDASFAMATFTRDAGFHVVTFARDARFYEATFEAGPGAFLARIRPNNLDFWGSSWPLGWTVELTDDAEQEWLLLVPVPVVLDQEQPQERHRSSRDITWSGFDRPALGWPGSGCP
ncbi:hypothetical protein GCM10027598_31320 [Amycolatopsis oliviviridis]|uniref:Pentapeptide repeat-containing protein n=1 Tax=Amycolatopsis oliviviridis TaxID=1471590 RepID=A0ABQ3LT15_9PSEU|nr:pentapeptide repeat-containing protein [Amycolatopsis oliviviridis]GHH24473.1 hypothetical protein GCM10017790_48840 [Amycolatopsis oliviviridis]